MYVGIVMHSVQRSIFSTTLWIIPLFIHFHSFVSRELTFTSELIHSEAHNRIDNILITLLKCLDSLSTRDVRL